MIDIAPLSGAMSINYLKKTFQRSIFISMDEFPLKEKMNPESGKRNKKSVEKISEPPLPKAPLLKDQTDSARDPLDVLADKFSGMKLEEIEKSKPVDPDLEQEKAFNDLVKNVLPEEPPSEK